MATARSAWRKSLEWIKRLRPRGEERHLPDFDEEILAAIKGAGIHPFVLVRCGDAERPENRILVCRTASDVPQFADRIATIPTFANSRLLRGIERALQQEIYEAAELLFLWAKAPVEGLRETAYIGNKAVVDLSMFSGYPVYELAIGTTFGSVDDRIAILTELFTAYECATGNDALRHALLEALALSLSRALGLSGRYQAAQCIIDRALAVTPYGIHLKAAKHALVLVLDGKQPPPRLQKFIGEDNDYMRQFVCTLPFERFDIGPDGHVMVCCGHWLPKAIGNLMNEPVDDVLNSKAAQKIRESVTDGTYKYCNHLECGAMVQGSLPKRDRVPSARTRDALAARDFRVSGVEQILFAFDQTCNLSCPSCRTHLIAEKASQASNKARAIEEKLLPLLPALRYLNINPAGELFASKPSRKLLELINDERCPDLLLDIISNGTLFSRDEWSKFPGIHNKVRSIRISVDAACKETFEKLRRLGNYDAFCENMRFLSELRTSGVIRELKFSFTYQLDNFREMRTFIDFCAGMRADLTIFERLQNIVFSHQEFRQKAVHYPDHPLYSAFIEVVRDPIFRTPFVWHDFDYEGVQNMSSEEAIKRGGLLVERPDAIEFGH
jgi:hypothetical protein